MAEPAIRKGLSHFRPQPLLSMTQALGLCRFLAFALSLSLFTGYDTSLAAEKSDKDKLLEALGKGIAEALAQQKKIEELETRATKANNAGNPGEALPLTEEILRLDKRNEIGLQEKGRALRELGHLPEAIAFLEQASKLKPKSFRLRNTTGYTYLKDKQYDKALGHLKAAALLDPRDFRVFNNLGEVQLGLGDLVSAEKSFKQVIALNPKFSDAYRKLGLCQAKAGKISEASASLGLALRLQPGDKETLAAIEELKQASGAPARESPAKPATPSDTVASPSQGKQVAPVVPQQGLAVSTQETSSWKGSLILKIPAGPFVAGRELPVVFSADSELPLLGVALYSKGEKNLAQSWLEQYEVEKKQGQFVLSLPLVPGDYELRAFAGTPKAENEAAKVLPLSLLPAKVPAEAAIPMAEVEDRPEESLPAPAIPKEPPLVRKRLKQATLATVEEALLSALNEWLRAESRQTQLSLQLEAEEPALVSNLALTQEKEAIHTELALKLSAERAKQILGDTPVSLVNVQAREKSPSLFLLRYPNGDLEKASKALAELIGAAHALGQPPAGKTKKKSGEAVAATGARSTSNALSNPEPRSSPRKRSSEPLPWDSPDWDITTPLPRHKGYPPKGVREYYLEIGPSVLGETRLIDLRFEQSDKEGLRITWAADGSPRGWGFRREFKELVVLNGQAQDNSARPNYDAATAPEGMLKELTLKVSKPGKPKTQSATPEPKTKAGGPYSNVVKTADAPIDLSDGEDAVLPYRKCQVRFTHSVQSKIEGNHVELSLERWNQILAVEADDFTDPSSRWIPLRRSQQIDKRVEIVGDFDPKTRLFKGRYKSEDFPLPGEEENLGKQPRQGAIERYATDYASLLPYEPEERPVWIAETQEPKGFLQPEPFKLPLVLKSNSDSKEEYLDSYEYPFLLSLMDVATGEEVAAALQGKIGLGAKEEMAFLVNPPARSGDWKLRVRLEVKKHFEEQDLVVSLGGFPARFVKSGVSARSVTAGLPILVDMEMANTWPKTTKDTPEARATGSWGLCDLDTGEYLPLSKGSSQPLFDLLPGQEKRACVNALSPSTRDGVWRLALVMWDLQGKMVGFRELAPVQLLPSLAQLAERQAALLAVEGKPSHMDLLWIADTQGRTQELQACLQSLKAKIAADEQSMKESKDLAPEVAERYKSRLSDLGEQRELLFQKLEETTRRSLGYFERRLKETPPNSEASQTLEGLRKDLIRQGKAAKLEAITSRRDVKGLVEVANVSVKEDPVMAAEAFRSLAALELENPREGSRGNALQCLLNASRLNPDDSATLGARRKLEKDYLKDVYAKYQIDMNEAQRKFEEELGNHGEAGFWGSFYDLAKTGVGTGSQNAIAKLTGEQSSIEAVVEVVDRIEQEVGVQQAGVLLLRKLVEAGLTIEDAGKLDIRQLYAVRALARKGLRPGVDPGKLGDLSEQERKALASVPAEQLKRIYPSLKKLMDSGAAISNEGLAAGLGSVKAALRNPDLAAISKGKVGGLSVDTNSDQRGYLKSADGLNLSLTQRGMRGVVDMANVVNLASFVPGVQTGSSGTTVMQVFVNGVSKTSPAAAGYLTAMQEARQGMNFATQLVGDLVAGAAVSYGVGKATGNEKLAELSADLFGVSTGAFDVESAARSLAKSGIEKVLVSGTRETLERSLKAASVPDLQLGEILKKVASDLDNGLGAQALAKVKNSSKAFDQALRADLPEALRGLRNTEAQLLEKLAKDLDSADLKTAKETVRLLDTVQGANNALLRRTEARAAALAQVEKRMLGGRTLSSEADALKDEFLNKLGRNVMPDGTTKLGEQEIATLLRDPDLARKYIDSGLLTSTQERQIAEANVDVFLKARQDAMDDLNLDEPLFAQLFHHFRDTGSWPGRETFRDIDFTPRLEVNPPITVLKELYEKRRLPGLATMSDETLLAFYRKDEDLKREVLLKFKENLGFHVGRRHGNPGAAHQVLESFKIEVNEIPGALVNGQREMSKELYRLKPAFGRSESMTGAEGAFITRVSVGKKGQVQLRSGFSADAVRQAGEEPLKLTPADSLAKVADEVIMSFDHASEVASSWLKVQVAGKYLVRISDDLNFLNHAPDNLVPAELKEALTQVRQRYAAVLDEWKQIKKLSGSKGYPAATEQVLKQRIDRFRTAFPTASEEQLKEMAGAEFMKEGKGFMAEMIETTSQIPGALDKMDPRHEVGSVFHSYYRQNPKLQKEFVLPWKKTIPPRPNPKKAP